MRKPLQIFAAMLLSLCIVDSYAIQVNVYTSSNDVSALGFSVNGSNYGGLGKSYSANNLPSNAGYRFGVRVGGIFGTDVPCQNKQGNAEIWLYNDTSADIDYHNNQCIVTIR